MSKMMSSLGQFSAAVLLFVIGPSSWATLTPATVSTSEISNEPFFGFQWALFPGNQTIQVDLDDIHPVTIQVDPKFSIHWANSDERMKRDVVVAVLDSGVDTSHPDLKSALLTGKDFSVMGTRRPQSIEDEIGHGTHVASVMAAEINNHEGIRGLSGRIKILPLKVYSELEGRSQDPLPIAKRVTAALEYAIEQKVDVINMSMGWPRSENTLEVEAAINKAIENGIVVVAGIGNDHHEAQIYPCAFRNVICVGSIDLNGELSSFSNFGGHVDVVAPGQAILGAWLTQEISRGFGPKGYEIKSGTSQSTPIVSALAATLKGMYPEQSALMIRQKILKTARHWYPLINFGLIDWQNALNSGDQPFTAPDFKKLDLVVVDPATKTFELPIVIESDSPGPHNFQVESESDGVTLDRLKAQGFDKNSGRWYYTATGRLASLGINNRFRYQIKIGSAAYSHQIIMAVNLEGSKPVEVNAPSERFALVQDPRGQTSVRVWDFKESKEHGTLVQLFSLQGSDWIEDNVVLKQVLGIYPGFGLVRSKWSNRRNDGYLIAGVEREGDDVKGLRIYYLDEDFRIAYNWPLDLEATLAYPEAKDKDVVLGSLASPLLDETIKVPVFEDRAEIPKADLNPDRFAFERNFTFKRIYYIEPQKSADGGIKAATRTLMAFEFERFVRTSLALEDTTDIEVIGLKTQSQDDLRLGRIRLLLFIGQGVLGQHYELSIDDLANPWKSENLKLVDAGHLDLRGGRLDEGWLITEHGFDRFTDIQTLYSFISARGLLGIDKKWKSMIFRIPRSGEKIVSTIKTFVRGSDQLALLETSDYIRAKGTWNGRIIDSHTQAYRSSFLPGNLFTQLFVPVLLGKPQVPGVMVDYSQFFSQAMSVYTLNEDGELFSPVRLSFQVPYGCRVARNAQWTEAGTSRILLLCQKSKEDPRRLLLIDLN